MDRDKLTDHGLKPCFSNRVGDSTVSAGRPARFGDGFLYCNAGGGVKHPPPLLPLDRVTLANSSLPVQPADQGTGRRGPDRVILVPQDPLEDLDHLLLVP